MEHLLTLAFDNLSSWEPNKVKKGLKQVEGLLAQLCLLAPPSSSSSKKKQSAPPPPSSSSDEGGASPPAKRAKDLAELSDDPAFREFFRLQDSFEWNIMQRLLNTLDRLVARGGDGQNDLLIMAALDLMQGVLLLHPPSKALFGEEKAMNILLDLTEPVNCPAVQAASLLTLVVALVDCPRNARTFERLEGLLTVTSLFKSKETPREVKLRLVEFLYFYLMPETPSIPRAAAPSSLLQRSPSKLARAFTGGGGGGGRGGDRDEKAGAANGASSSRQRADSEGGGLTRSTEQKQAYLGQHLPSVEDLVRDLQENRPFDGVVE